MSHIIFKNRRNNIKKQFFLQSIRFNKIPVKNLKGVYGDLEKLKFKLRSKELKMANILLKNNEMGNRFYYKSCANISIMWNWFMER